LDAQARAAVAGQRLQGHAALALGRAAEDEVERDGDPHALVEGALAEVLEGDVGQGEVAADNPAILELAVDGEGRAPVAGQVAAQVHLVVEAVAGSQ
jgi:hypothetical protein